MESWPRRHRITVDEYHRMGEVGLLAPDARVELIEGEIIDMAPIGTDHASVVNRLNRLLVMAVGERGIVQIQGPARLDRYSEPEPDVVVFAPRPDFYRHVRPTLAETLLVIEVSDRTLRHDRDVKVPLYARHGIREVWIVDLQNGELHVHCSPQDGRYVEQATTNDPGITPLSALPGVEVDLSGILEG
jgi:Uma2 family endonuclease